jgi:hypothetical protein
MTTRKLIKKIHEQLLDHEFNNLKNRILERLLSKKLPNITKGRANFND